MKTKFFVCISIFISVTILLSLTVAAFVIGDDKLVSNLSSIEHEGDYSEFIVEDSSSLYSGIVSTDNPCDVTSQWTVYRLSRISPDNDTPVTKETGYVPVLVLYTNNNFTFNYDPMSDYETIGTYDIVDDVLTAKTTDGKYTYCFNVKDSGTLVYLAGESSEVNFIDESVVNRFYDGAVFSSVTPNSNEENNEKTDPQVKDDENFVFTQFDDDVYLNEYADNFKIQIYDKMFSTFNLFSSVELTLKTSMFDNCDTTIKCATKVSQDSKNISSYESIINDNGVNMEYYGNSDGIIAINNKDKTIETKYMNTYSTIDAYYIPLHNRITVDNDGIPCYNYRPNGTNCPSASYSLLPQEFAFSYLKNFELWNIRNSGVEYLGRKCVEIEGTPTSYFVEKHNIDSFTMLIDYETGVLLDFTGYKNGEVTNYVTVIECVFDSDIKIEEFIENNYLDYTPAN